jgi:hypothetical protein
MEPKIIETVLTEVLNELKDNNQAILELTGKMTTLGDKVAAFEKNQEQLKIVAPPANTAPIEKLAENYFLKFYRLVEAQPKKVVRQFRLVLFPETNTDRYYKIVFGRIIPWSYGLAAVFFLISFGKQYVSSWSEIQERRNYYEIYMDAWDRLDKSLDKTGRQKMKEIMQKAVNEHEKK